jgi:hypothetical protein
MLTHYTKTIAAVGNILANGFAWVPNTRKLTKLLLPKRNWGNREPQQFGMISFTELQPEAARAHRAKYGAFGIVVNEAWAKQRGAQRVIYVSESGPLTNALQKIYDIGYQDLKARIEYPEDGAWQMSYENKAMASAVAGAALWSELLSVWEFLEPESSYAEQEWRMVNALPDYSLVGPTSDIIAAVSPPLNWARWTRLVSVTPHDVEAFVCPAPLVSAFHASLPEEFQRAQIVECVG